MGDVIYLQRSDAERSETVEEFVLAYVPIRRGESAGAQPLRECGLPPFGRPHSAAHDLAAVSESYPLGRHRVRTSRLLSRS